MLMKQPSQVGSDIQIEQKSSLRKLATSALLATTLTLALCVIPAQQALASDATCDSGRGAICTQIFDYTGKVESWTIPSYVRSLTYDVTGGVGGRPFANNVAQTYQKGIRMSGTIRTDLIGPRTLTVAVGDGGTNNKGYPLLRTDTTGQNPLGGYSSDLYDDGENPAFAWPPSGGAATVVRFGGVDVVAGGSGANSQFASYAWTLPI
jgi:hypothetical protein